MIRKNASLTSNCSDFILNIQDCQVRSCGLVSLAWPFVEEDPGTSCSISTQEGGMPPPRTKLS